MNFYAQELMKHYKNPRNFGTLQNPDLNSLEYNPSCGDNIEIQAKINNGQILDNISFKGNGCAISISCASKLTEFCKNKTLEQVLALSNNDILSLLQLELGPTRMKCALLALSALQKGIEEYQVKKYVKSSQII